MSSTLPSEGSAAAQQSAISTGPARSGAAQLLSAGLLTAIVGFASAFPIVLQGLTSVGATRGEAASGLLALCLVQGLLGIWLSLRWRQPISIAWSTPGAALLMSTGLPAGGFPVAIGAFLVAGGLIVVAGLFRPFARAVSAIPMGIANAMLAGVLLELCLAPVHAVGAMPALVLPIIIVWALAWRFARLYAVPIAVVVTALIVIFATSIPPDALADIWPHPIIVAPRFTLATVVSIALPLFIVTMASQNVPGLAVLRLNGYQPKVERIFLSTGLASGVTAFFGGHLVNLAAITAALSAGPEAHADPSRRYIAAVTAGASYLVLGLLAGFAAAFIAAAPPLLIQAVAGLALLGSLAAALAAALTREGERIPVILTFVTTASGISFFGIGAAFWGLVAGGLLLGLNRLRK
jgi:benzoate membrane transport protein